MTTNDNLRGLLREAERALYQLQQANILPRRNNEPIRVMRAKIDAALASPDSGEVAQLKASLKTHIDVIGLQEKELCRLRVASRTALESLEELCGKDFCDPVLNELRALNKAPAKAEPEE